MTELPTLVLSLTPPTEDRLLPDLIELGCIVVARPAGAAEASNEVARARAEVLLASADPRHLDAGLIAACEQAGVQVVALADGVDEREAATSLGLRSVLDADASVTAILAAIERDAADAPAPQRSAMPTSRGTVVTVWGPTGAPGRTTTAIAIAAELAASGARVALVDADTVGAAVAPSLGLLDESPGLAAACRLAGAGALTPAELDRIAQPYRGRRGGFAVLTGIGRAARWPELSVDRVGGVLDAARGWADYTVVDAGFNLEADEEIVSDLFAPRRNAATLASLRAADLVVAVGAADPVGLGRLVRGWGDLLEAAATDRVAVVVTKVRASAVGLNPNGQIASTLSRFAGIEGATLVPNDPGGCDAALLTARALPDASPRSPAAAAIRRLVQERIEVRRSVPRRSFLRRKQVLPA
jgi:MinD-like ATPase involved in chromosome partitioning or flagellar assembly